MDERIIGPPGAVTRAARRLLTPLSRGMARRSHGFRFDAPAVDRADPTSLLLFMIVIPGAEELARRNAERLADHCRLTIVLNGHAKRRAAELAETLPARRVLRLATVPGFPVKHGTALTVLLDRVGESFGILDPDCLIRDPGLLKPPRLEPDEFVAAPDHPHCYDVNAVTGERFPRTHFLVLNRHVVRNLMTEYGITAEKYFRPPPRLREPLGRQGYGTHNYPRTHLRHFDTLLLLMAMARSRGLRVRWLQAKPSAVDHLKRSREALARKN